MKKIEAVIPHARLELVLSALKDMGLGGLTYFESKGRGQPPRPTLHSGRGTSTYTPEFNLNTTLVVVTRDSAVDSVLDTILENSSTGLKGEGKIFVYELDDAVDIGSKSRGEAAI
ncbi:MAG TPA: P-II family nitrogen regulator [Nitrososphaeraceae archaeon]|jgi:nitrogen regulatory protein P-II 1|nr:P-II family nitrogen regulator [Nitrososphaeraceae archaeon]